MSKRDVPFYSQSVKTADEKSSDSLFDYLPEDLESLTYIPKDMQRSVQAAIEARARVAENRARRQKL